MNYLKTKLMPHQEAHLKKAVLKRRLLLTEKTGRGKTLIELAVAGQLLHEGKIDAVFVSTPKTAYEKKVWESECSKHTTLKTIDFETLVVKSSGRTASAAKLMKHFNVVFAKHSHVKQHTTFIRELIGSVRFMVIVDEIQALKNPRSTLTRLSRFCYAKAAALHGLTATPLSKSLEDSYHIINFVRPGSLGTFLEFRDNYCTTREVVIGRMRGGNLKKALVIEGIKNEEGFNNVISSFVLKGETSVHPEFHFFDYVMDSREEIIYRKIAKGIASTGSGADEPDWLSRILRQVDEAPPSRMKDLQAHSSRFIYLQYAADGIVNEEGLVGLTHGAKYRRVLEILDSIVEKRQSVLVYFSYHASVDTMERLVSERYPQAKILKSTGKDTLDEHAVTEASVKRVPHIILCTKAGSESVSYYYMNNVIFVHYPTVAETMVQMAGRICRVNTLFPDDLHIYMPRCPNIDDYKLLVVSHKTGLMEKIAGAEGNIPDIFKDVDWSGISVKQYKNQLLWNAPFKRRV